MNIYNNVFQSFNNKYYSRNSLYAFRLSMFDQIIILRQKVKIRLLKINLSIKSDRKNRNSENVLFFEEKMSKIRFNYFYDDDDIEDRIKMVVDYSLFQN